MGVLELMKKKSLAPFETLQGKFQGLVRFAMYHTTFIFDFLKIVVYDFGRHIPAFQWAAYQKATETSFSVAG